MGFGDLESARPDDMASRAALRRDLLEQGLAEETIESYERDLDAGSTVLFVRSGTRADEVAVALSGLGASDVTAASSHSGQTGRGRGRRPARERVERPSFVDRADDVPPGREPTRRVTPYEGRADADTGLTPRREVLGEDRQKLELREERLVANKEMREAGEVVIRTELDEVPGRLELDAVREEVEVEHEPVGTVVRERREPWEEGDTLIIPVYEEQLVVSKRLVLREHLRIRRVAVTERQVFEEPLLRERLVVEDPEHTGLVHEQYPEGEPEDRSSAEDRDERSEHESRHEEGGFLHGLVRRALQ
jgi:uncharacterized protein (TIGR02271 family)